MRSTPGDLEPVAIRNVLGRAGGHPRVVPTGCPPIPRSSRSADGEGESRARVAWDNSNLTRRRVARSARFGIPSISSAGCHSQNASGWPPQGRPPSASPCRDCPTEKVGSTRSGDVSKPRATSTTDSSVTNVRASSSVAALNRRARSSECAWLSRAIAAMFVNRRRGGGREHSAQTIPVESAGADDVDPMVEQLVERRGPPRPKRADAGSIHGLGKVVAGDIADITVAPMPPRGRDDLIAGGHESGPPTRGCRPRSSPD